MAMTYKFPPGEFTTTAWLELNGRRVIHGAHGRARLILESLGYQSRSVPNPLYPHNTPAALVDQARSRIWSLPERESDQLNASQE